MAAARKSDDMHIFAAE